MEREDYLSCDGGKVVWRERLLYISCDGEKVVWRGRRLLYMSYEEEKGCIERFAITIHVV